MKLRVGLACVVLVAAAAGGGWVYAAGASTAALTSLWDRAREPLRGSAFRLARVHFVGLEKLDASELWSRTGVGPATALLDLDPASLCRALAGHPRVGRCRVARLHPDRLVFEIAERRPVAQDAAEKLGIDAAGERFPLRPGEGDGLPRVRGKSVLVLPLVLAARARGLALDGVEAARPGELRMRPSGSDVVVRVGEDPERSLDAWQRVRASGLIESYGAREVDLRFSGDAVLRGLTRKKGGG